ncbi:carbohydrate ABC transporter substrate-binding protein, CUT1 family [Poseidonocella pacifica]|uniref:Carbohydrate ABC transporter substrate-binding protein, CUT1 family n=1 Tax=Poseidonocella pacifica TaxID=871651 RepID=A0A1I0YWU9_9RHOB|nr:sugar ABC transporter substrate-binding protein [Poseidonocella pacifica]SFB17316.1 carbohydrate ABC transporter substrate-binding protein, CUT1 family [Poseidonocella pacifica]
MTIYKTLGLACSALAFSAAIASADSTVRFWYHFDNADNPMDELVANFEAANPGITVEAENIPWNSYYDNLYTAVIGGNAPDAAMVKMFAQPRLIGMGALEPIGERIDAWDGKADLLDNLLDLTKAEDGKSYYLPVQYVVLYLYYRPDMFAELGLDVPATCEDFRNVAQQLTRDTDGDGQTDIYGFGFRGGKGGHDHWGSFTLGREGVNLVGGMENDSAAEGTQFVVDLFQEDKVFPPSAPNDGFQETIGGFKAGKTAMTIHHIGSANGMVEALGDNVDAAPVPSCGGGQWTAYGDESTAVLSSAEDKDAAWKWISFLSESGNNAKFNEATGQLPVTKSDSDGWTLHPKRFVDATVNSLPFAHLLPNTPETSDFVNTVWPVSMQRALTGDITAEEMNAEIAKLFGN